MKRALPLLDRLREPPPQLPRFLRLRSRLVSLIDTGDGMACARFAEALLVHGGAVMASEIDSEPDLRIVIRGAPKSSEARLRAELLEAGADLVLGSARPAFAKVFCSACAPWVNS